MLALSLYSIPSHKLMIELKGIQLLWGLAKRPDSSQESDRRGFPFSPSDPKTLMLLLCFQLVVYWEDASPTYYLFCSYAESLSARD